MGANFLSNIGKGFKKFGKGTTHFAENAFNWTTKTVGKGVDKVFDLADSAISGVTDVFKSPLLLIVVGVVVVGGIMVISRR